MSCAVFKDFRTAHRAHLSTPLRFIAMQTLDVLVIGAGIAGLTCAISLARHDGVRVTILESASLLGELGNGIQVPSNATHILRKLGLLDKLLAKAGGSALEARSIDLQTGTTLFTRNLGRCEELYGAPWLIVHRDDYMNILQEEALRLGINIRLGCKIRSVDLDAPSVSLENGELCRADVIIGCDGVHSVVRAALHPKVRMHTTGAVAYRSILTRSQLTAASPELAGVLLEQTCRFWLGPMTHAVVYPVRNGATLNVVLMVTEQAFNEKCEGPDANVLELVRERLQNYDPIVREMMALTHTLARFPVRDMPDLPTWSRGCVALAGDAAHPMPPYLAQGAALAVEDAYILGSLFGRLAQQQQRDPSSAKPQIPDILRAYTNLQRPRAMQTVAKSKLQGTFNHLPDGRERTLRDAEFAAYSVSNPTTFTSVCPWIDARTTRDLLARNAADMVEKEWARLSAAAAATATAAATPTTSKRTDKMRCCSKNKAMRYDVFRNWIRSRVAQQPQRFMRRIGMSRREWQRRDSITHMQKPGRL